MKTTLLPAISLIDPPTSGRLIMLAGEPCTSTTDRVYHMVDGRIDPRGRPSRAPRDENGVRPPTAQA